MNLSVDIAGVTMKNPVTTGSGTFGSGEEFSEFVDLSKLLLLSLLRVWKDLQIH